MPHVPGHKPGTVVSSGGQYKPYTPKTQNQNQNQNQSAYGYSPGYIPPEDRKKDSYVNKIIQDNVNKLKNIQDNKDALVNQAAIPKYLKKGHKFYDKMTDDDGKPIPFDQMNEAQKSIAQFYHVPNYNAYQQELNNFINTGPIQKEIYKQDGGAGAAFNLFMTDAVPAYLSKGISFGQPKNEYFAGEGSTPIDYSSLVSQNLGLDQETGNVFTDIANNFIEKSGQAVNTAMTGMEAAADAGKDAIIDIFTDDPVSKPELFTNIKNQQALKPTTFTVNRPNMANVANITGLPSILNTSTDTPGVDRIFKLPSDFKGDFNNQYFLGTSPNTEKKTDNYMVYNPNIQSLMGMNLNQGGLASLDNQDYNMLMNASNFGF